MCSILYLRKTIKKYKTRKRKKRKISNYLNCHNIINKNLNTELPYACYFTNFYYQFLSTCIVYVYVYSFLYFTTWFKKKERKIERRISIAFYDDCSELHTSCPLLLVSLLTRLNFLPNLLTELALNMSLSLVLLIGIVPLGHDSPDKLHN